MAAVSIEWTRVTEDGVKLRMIAERAGDRWTFRSREKRFDRWEEDASPPPEAWLELLDAVRRRVVRGLLRPEEQERLARRIRELFPDARVP